MRLPPLVPGTLLARRKRFLADVRLDEGRPAEREVVAWCANPGRMTSCMEPGWRVWLSAAPEGSGRKLAWTWELSETPDGQLILVNTSRPNSVVAEAVAAGVLPELAGYASLRREVRVGRSRFDLVLDGRDADRRTCFVEIKSVSMLVQPGVAAFPDAVTARGRKHLVELQDLASQGHRAVLLLALSRGDASVVRPADEVDPAWGAALRQAIDHGVEVLARRSRVRLDGVELGDAVPLRL